MFYGREKLTAAHAEHAAPQQPDDHGRAAHRQDDLPPPPEARARGGRGGRLEVLPGVRRPAGRARAGVLPRPDVRGRRRARVSSRRATRCASAPERDGYEARDFSHDLPLVLAELQDAHREEGEAGAADRRGGRAQRVLRERQPAPARHLHEELLGEPRGGDERRRDPPPLEERGLALVQLLRRDRARAVHARGGRGARSGSRWRASSASSPRPSSGSSSCRGCGPTSSRSTACTPSTACWRRAASTIRLEDVEAARACGRDRAPPAAPRPTRPRARRCGRLGSPWPRSSAATRNPFIVGSFVRGEDFFGRQALIGEILEGERQSIWVLGGRRLGKTSLLREVEHRVQRSRETPFVALYWDLQGSGDARGLAETLLVERRGRRGLPPRDRRVGRGPREPARSPR